MLAAPGNGVQRDESLIGGVRIVHHDCNLSPSEPIPMRKPPTGEPCAGKPHARFGGRGRRKPFPTPIKPELFYFSPRLFTKPLSSNSLTMLSSRISSAFTSLTFGLSRAVKSI